MTKTNFYTDALSHPIFEYISQATADLKLESYVIGGFVRDYFLTSKYWIQDMSFYMIGIRM